MAVPKRFVIISNTGDVNITKAFEQHTDRIPDILILSAKKLGKLSIAGDLLTSEEAKQKLENFLMIKCTGLPKTVNNPLTNDIL